MIVVADTTPLNYLVRLGHIDILPALYQRVAIPVAVQQEMLHRRAPSSVRAWIKTAPSWLEIFPVQQRDDPFLDSLDAGERDAILLAEALHARQLVMDEREGRRVAEGYGLQVIGTLGVLRDAAQAGMLDLAQTIKRLQEMRFHISKAVLEDVLGETKE